MQKQYLALGSREVYNGEYLLAVYHLEPYGDKTLAGAATELAAEASTGSNVAVGSATNFSQTLDAQVFEIDEEKNLAYIGFNWRMFDTGGNVQNVLTFIAGNIFGASSFKACKLLDVQFPPQMLTQYDGPSYSLDDMRRYLKAYDTPIIGTIIKPKIGLTPHEYAELCYDFWSAGGHFVKNDEPQADQSYAPFTKMVDSVRSAMDSAEDKLGKTFVHSFNVSAPDFDEMIRRADYVQEKMRPGSYAMLVDGITAGWTAIQTIRRRYPNTFLHYHRAGHGAFTRKENPFGFTVQVLTKFARLAGASGIHTGTAGVGKMDGDPKEDIGAMQQALRLKSQGEHFEQVWANVSEEDSDIERMIKSEESMWSMGARELSKMRSEVTNLDSFTVTHNSDWRTMKKCTPIVSGGLNPVLLPEFLEIAGTIDFITTMGGGVHSHPMKTSAGVKAIFESLEGWKQGQSVEEASTDHIGNDRELQSALRFYGKKRPNPQTDPSSQKDEDTKNPFETNNIFND